MQWAEKLPSDEIFSGFCQGMRQTSILVLSLRSQISIESLRPSKATVAPERPYPTPQPDHPICDCHNSHLFGL